MEDLSLSPLLDGRYIRLIREIISGGRVNPINEAETTLIKNSSRIQDINRRVEKGLVRRLEEYKAYTPVREAMLFLLEADELGRLDAAFEILEFTQREERACTREEFLQILQDDSVPMGLALMLYAEEIDPRHSQKRALPSSGLNLEALKNFK